MMDKSSRITTTNDSKHITSQGQPTIFKTRPNYTLKWRSNRDRDNPNNPQASRKRTIVTSQDQGNTYWMKAFDNSNPKLTHLLKSMHQF